MKRVLLTIALALLLLAPNLAAQDFSLTFTANILAPADENYKAIYGNTTILPELKANYYFNNIFVWAGFGLLSGTGTTPILEAESKSSQNFLSLGAGYGGNTGNKVDFAVQAGLVFINYSEEAFDIKITGSTIGFRGDALLLFNISDSFFIEINAGYIYGTDNVEGLAEAIKLGGIKGGAGLGIRF